jgi:hypothetical protein
MTCAYGYGKGQEEKGRGNAKDETRMMIIWTE